MTLFTAGSLALLISLFSPVVNATPSKLTVCGDSPEDELKGLSAYQGLYAAPAILDRIKSHRKWAQDVSPGFAEIRITESGRVMLNIAFHEGVGLGGFCLEVDGETARVWERPSPESVSWGLNPDVRYLRISNKLPDVDSRISWIESAPYFVRLLNGCYQDQGHNRWCFGASNLRINDGQPIGLQLVLDSQETLGGVNAVSLDTPSNRYQYWFFEPTPKGWDVYRGTDPNSDTYKPPIPGKNKVWKRLKRLSSAEAPQNP